MGGVLRGRLAMILSLAIGLFAADAAQASKRGYTYYEMGNVSAPTPGKTETGLLLMGGGEWDPAAFRWFFGKAGNGHIVVLSASCCDEEAVRMYRVFGGVASVRTFVFDDRKASTDRKVLAALEKADGIFLAGGDQSNYVRYWKGTPVQKALNDHVARGRPIGGTSAGLAVLGAVGYGAMDGGSVDSPTALSDPMGPQVTMVRDFLAMPFLGHIVTDTHFAARDRLGRLVAFLAQVRATSDRQAVGIGVDEASALCVDARGIGRFFTAGAGYAWLVEPDGVPQVATGKPLDKWTARVTGIGPQSEIDLNTLRVVNPAFQGSLSVESGKLLGVPAPPGPPWSAADKSAFAIGPWPFYPREVGRAA